MHAPRLILYHKQSTSARTRFLRLGHGSVCGPHPLPPGAELLREDAALAKVITHPIPLVRAAETQLGLPAGSLEADHAYRYRVTWGVGESEVFLARFTATDPPFEAAAALGATFIDLTQARALPATELDLLHRAYELILG
jgi:hypothetical protein